MLLVEGADRTRNSFIDRIGIYPPLAWGFVGLLLFMIGDGVESGFLSPYLELRGIPQKDVALIFTIYGVTAAIAAWLSGALSDLWGPRQVMGAGLIIWVVFEVAFLLFGIAPANYPLILLPYALRGFGYPLFAFGFLVWVTVATPQGRQGTAVGWFWFAFTGGLPTLGSLLASFSVPHINTAPQFGFLVFLPTYFTKTIGFSITEWLRLLSLIFLSNIVWNLLFGIIGDKVGWRQTVAFCGGFGSAVTTLLLYYTPHWLGPNFPLVALAGILYGATLAGYVPLSALMPALAPEHKGAAMSILNLGAGASTWVGPGIVALFLSTVGVAGVMWIFAVLYLVSGVMALFLTFPPEMKAVVSTEKLAANDWPEEP